jgi:para-nitrobenzyl esterase
VNILNGANKAGGKAYAYIFDHVPAEWKKDGVVAAHGMEVPYVFGDLGSRPFWAVLFVLAKPSGAKSPDPGLTDTDRKVSEIMMQMWINFASNGNPGVKGLVAWPSWEQGTDRYLYITELLEVKSGFSRIPQK